MGRVKVFYVTDNWLPNVGGLESSSQYLAEALSDRFDIEVLTFERQGIEDTNHPVRVRRFSNAGTNSYYGPALDYIRTISQSTISIVHVFGFSYFWPAQQAWFISSVQETIGCPIILKVPTSGHPSRYMHGSLGDAIGAISVFIALTESIRTELRTCGIDEHRISVISNGVPIDRFHPKSKSSLLPPNIAQYRRREQPLVMFAGRFTQQKRMDVLIRGAESVPRAERPLILLVGFVDHTYGDGFEINQHLSEFLVHVPTQTDMCGMFPCADAYVSASQAEGMPNAVLEAMACGLPVIGSDIPGHRELVVPEHNGWLFPEGDWRSLAKILQSVGPLKSTGELKAMGRHSREIVMRGFSIETVAEQYSHLYRRLACISI